MTDGYVALTIPRNGNFGTSTPLILKLSYGNSLSNSFNSFFKNQIRLLEYSNCRNASRVKHILLARFKNKFVPSDEGRDYFSGNVEQMRQEFLKVMYEHSRTLFSDETFDPIFDNIFLHDFRRNIVKIKIQPMNDPISVYTDDGGLFELRLDDLINFDFRDLNSLEEFSVSGTHDTFAANKIQLPTSVEYVQISNITNAVQINWNELINLHRIEFVNCEVLPDSINFPDSLYIFKIEDSDNLNTNLKSLSNLLLYNDWIYTSGKYNLEYYNDDSIELRIKDQLGKFTQTELERLVNVLPDSAELKLDKPISVDELVKILTSKYWYNK